MATSRVRRTICASSLLALALLAAHWLLGMPSPDRSSTASFAAGNNTFAQNGSGTTVTSIGPSTPRKAFALKARRVRTMPDGTRRVADIQYDHPYFRSTREGGAQLVDLVARELLLLDPDGHVAERLPLAPDSYCDWYFGPLEPGRTGAEQIEDVEYDGRSCTVWELPHREEPPAHEGGDFRTVCHDLGGVRITVCDDVPLPSRVVLPGGTVECLESVRLLPAGSLLDGVAPPTAP